MRKLKTLRWPCLSFLRDMVMSKKIVTPYVKSEEQLGDVFTFQFTSIIQASHRHGNRAESKMSSNRCWQQAFHRSKTHAWEVSPVFLLPRYGKRLKTSSSWNISHLLALLFSIFYLGLRHDRTATQCISFLAVGREVQRNMSTGLSLVSDWISTGRDLKANIPLIEHPFLCLMMIQPAISMHGISLGIQENSQ